MSFDSFASHIISGACHKSTIFLPNEASIRVVLETYISLLFFKKWKHTLLATLNNVNIPQT